MSMEVRFATEKDRVECLALDQFMTVDKLSEWLSKNQIIVARESERTIGYLRFMFFWTNLPYICFIMVVEERRNEGVGKALVNYLEVFLRKQGFNKILSSTDVDEVDSQRWHRKLGFEEAGFIREINEDGVGEIFYLKRLLDP